MHVLACLDPVEPRSHVSTLDNGGHAQDDDALVRERAAGSLEYVASKEVGARDIIQVGVGGAHTARPCQLLSDNAYQTRVTPFALHA